MLTILKRLFGNPKTESDRDAFRRAISIDVSGVGHHGYQIGKQTAHCY